MHADTHARTTTTTRHEGDLDMTPNAPVLACRHVRPMARHRRRQARRPEGRLARPLAPPASGAHASTLHDHHDAHPKDTAMNTHALTRPTDADTTTHPEMPMHADHAIDPTAATTTHPNTEIPMPAIDANHNALHPSTTTPTQETPMPLDHSDPITPLSNPNPTHDTTPPASAERSRARRVFEPRVLKKPMDPADLQFHAGEEIRWLHSPAAEKPRHAARRAVLLGWLGRLSGLHRGIIALAYDERSFSPLFLGNICFASDALVVRVDCAAHPMQGTVEEAERASVARIEALIRAGKQKQLAALEHRADERLDEAVAAFAEVRGQVAPIVPKVRRRPVKKKPVSTSASTPATHPGDATA